MTDKLAIIVPYRDRQEHLDVFVPHMHEFLKDKGIDYTIFIAEQTDDRPFNYGKLCNVATKEVGEEYTYFAFHDIDMLPISDECDYGYPDSPTHLATNVEAHNNELPYPQYFGGVILISREDFEKTNGYSNEYWGYGFEDLDLLYRLQRSGAYLEKFYDLNKTYSTLNELDILPYRIEEVNIVNNKKEHKITYNNFDNPSRLYNSLNNFSKKIVQDSFSISFWFNDDNKKKKLKNLFAFEGCDTGIFLSNGNQIISQIWDNNSQHKEIVSPYSRNRWNHVIISFDNKNKTLTLYLNTKKTILHLDSNFTIYDYTNHCIKVSDTDSEIKISNINLYSESLSQKIVNEIYYNGNKIDDLLMNKYGIFPKNLFNFNKTYKKSFVIDVGPNLNHLKVEGKLNVNDEIVSLTDEIYLPFRLQGEYKSLSHEKDTNIIERYYKYDPDILENADIFFYDVITNNLDYKTVGLSTLKYKILDTQERKGYELIRIVT